MRPTPGPKLAKELRPSQAQSGIEARAAKAARKARRDDLRLKAKANRFWAVSHLKTLPIREQKQLNRAYKKQRTSGQTMLSYARWCAELFRQPDDPSQYPGAIKQIVEDEAWAAAATNAE